MKRLVKNYLCASCSGILTICVSFPFVLLPHESYNQCADFASKYDAKSNEQNREILGTNMLNLVHFACLDTFSILSTECYYIAPRD